MVHPTPDVVKTQSFDGGAMVMDVIVVHSYNRNGSRKIEGYRARLSKQGVAEVDIETGLCTYTWTREWIAEMRNTVSAAFQDLINRANGEAKRFAE